MSTSDGSHYVLEFEIGYLPKMSNQMLRSHWRTKAGYARQWRGRVMQEIYHVPKDPLLKARLTLTRCSARAPDYEGLVSGFKPIIDALVTAGVLKDDNMKIVGVPTYLWESAPVRKGKIRVKVEEIK